MARVHRSIENGALLLAGISATCTIATGTRAVEIRDENAVI
jgi:hypothetical protein